jgi:mitochondrial inner membrane protease ATP23
MNRSNPEILSKQSDTSHKQCLKWVEKLNSSPLISFLSSKTFLNPSVSCSPCRSLISGGYNPSTNTITICQDTLKSKQQLQDILAHEYIHAYDTSTTKLDWTNPKHQACTEIRATTLSGECNFTREVLRGNLGIGKQLQACIRRRSVLGLVANGMDEKNARIKVEECWKCFEDLAPFDEIY